MALANSLTSPGTKVQKDLMEPSSDLTKQTGMAPLQTQQLEKPAIGVPSAGDFMAGNPAAGTRKLPGADLTTGQQTPTNLAPVAETSPGTDDLPTAPAGSENLEPISYTAPSKSQGLIDRAMNYDFKANAGPMEGPTAWNPEGGALVENRLSNLLSDDSVYLQRARARAAQATNARGLLNSTMGAQAGEAAAIDAALPIAQQDAGTMSAAGQFNANAKNSFASEGNAFSRQGSLQRFGLLSNTAQQASAQEFQTSEREASQKYGTSEREAAQRFTDAQRNAQNAWQSSEAQLGRDFTQKMMQEQQKLNDATRNNEVATRFVSAYYDNVNQILRDPNLDPATKQAQVQKALENTKAAMAFLDLSDAFDLSKLLNFG